MSRSTVNCVVFCIWAVAAVCRAEEPMSEPTTGTPTQITTTNDDAFRLQVEVVVNTSAPLLFMVDTASTRTVIASDVAERLKLTAGRAVNVKNIAGEDRAATVIIPELHFAGNITRNIMAPSLLRSNLGVEGLIGLDILKGLRMSINFRDHANISLIPSNRKAEPHPEPDEPGTIIVQAKSRLGELILTDAEIDGQRISVIIDTGSANSVGNAALRRLVSRRIAKSAIVPITLLSVTGRQIPADYTQIGRVRIGGVEVENLPIAFADANTFQQFGLARRPALLLGMEVLRLFDKVTLDFPKRQVRFLPVPKIK